MRRALAGLLLIAALAPGTWFYETGRPWNGTVAIRFTPLTLPSPAVQAGYLGAFRLEGAWTLTSPYSLFGGYSALLPLPDGRLMAISDSARRFTFSPPGVAPSLPESGEVIPDSGRSKFGRDIEAATHDPVSGVIWTAREYANAISRHDAAFARIATVHPGAMRDWGLNSGPEAMVRLGDGRFLVLAEEFTGPFEPRRHAALLFPGDPVRGGEPLRFTFAGSPEFSPVDMAQLPDGRVLILMRRLVWPFPLHFAGRIMIANPADIRPGRTWQATEVVKLASVLPVDNFEGLAIAPHKDGTVTVWLISDDNAAVTQRTLLWQLTVDPARLPDSREKARR